MILISEIKEKSAYADASLDVRTEAIAVAAMGGS
jgi:hypothetical protein